MDAQEKSVVQIRPFFRGLTTDKMALRGYEMKNGSEVRQRKDEKLDLVATNDAPSMDASCFCGK